MEDTGNGSQTAWCRLHLFSLLSISSFCLFSHFVISLCLVNHPKMLGSLLLNGNSCEKTYILTLGLPWEVMPTYWTNFLICKMAWIILIPSKWEVRELVSWFSKHFLNRSPAQMHSLTYLSQNLINWYLALFGLVVQDGMFILILHSESSQEF